MLFELYAIIINKNATFKTNVADAVKLFMAKYGYAPKQIYTRESYLLKGDIGDLEPIQLTIQPGHFGLGPVKDITSIYCDVMDMHGNHCPEIAIYTIDFKGNETHLCERCYNNVLNGAYGG